jgi:hypothetical protein
MEALRWELPTSLAEAVFQGRTGRLMDLGFPDPDQVLEVYAFIDPDRFDVAGYRRSSGWQADEVSPGFVLTATRPGDLLAEVLAAGVNAETGWELTCLVNRVLAADKAEVGDRSQVRAAMDRVFGCLNLALEHLAGADVRQATQLFAETWLLPLFRLGYSLTLQLRRRARQLREASIGPYLDEPLAGFLATLARDCPRYPAGLDEASQAAERPFRNLADVRRAEQCLAETEALRRLFGEHFSFPLPAPAQLDLADCHPAEVEAVGLRHFFLTALANRLLGRPFDPSPLAPEDLSLLHARVCRAGQLRDDLRGETRSWLEKLEPDAWPFADFCLQAWNENLCPLRADRLDPRFLEGLLVKTVPSC